MKLARTLFLKTQNNTLLNEEERQSFFKELYELHNSHIRKTLYWMAGPNAVDDLVQETFLKAWKALPNFKRQSSPKTWLHRIALNTTYDFLRKNGKKLEAQDIHTHETHDTRDVIIKGVQNLSENHRGPFVLFYQLGHSQDEIAELLNIPKGTVKSRLHTARNQFTEFLKQNGVSYE